MSWSLKLFVPVRTQSLSAAQGLVFRESMLEQLKEASLFGKDDEGFPLILQDHGIKPHLHDFIASITN
jgi:hypothetical protein